MEDEARVEASLGGRVTAEEMAVLQDELADVIDTLENKPFLLVLDYAKAKNFDLDTRVVLADLKDFCFANGAAKIVSIVQDEDAMVSQCTERIQAVLEGREELMLEPREVAWQAPAAQVVRKAA